MQIFTRLTAAAALFTAATLIIFSACRKDRNDEDTGYAADHAILEKTFSDVQSIADEAGNNGSLANYKMIGGANVLSGCASVTNDTTATPRKLTIDFGAVNCLCSDGIYRRGKILVSYTGRYKDAGHSHTITFENYFVNDNGVSGVKTVTYTGNSTAGLPVYQIEVTGAIALANGNGTVSWTSSRTRTWTAGYSTAAWNDDEYEITGSGTVTRANGSIFTVQSIAPLHVALNCRWIESGIVQITPQGGGKARTLDYGNGACDAQAAYTVNGKTYSVTLR